VGPACLSRACLFDSSSRQRLLAATALFALWGVGTVGENEDLECAPKTMLPSAEGDFSELFGLGYLSDALIGRHKWEQRGPEQRGLPC
jgi:hypothetical protein